MNEHTSTRDLRKDYIVLVRAVGVSTILAVTASVVRANYMLSMEWGWMR
jgi:hypothetical protein